MMVNIKRLDNSQKLYGFFISISIFCMILQTYTVVVSFYREEFLEEKGIEKVDGVSFEEGKLNLKIPVHQYIFTRNISGIPLTILIYAMMAYTVIYAGSESIVSIIKMKTLTASDNKINCNVLPESHRIRVVGALKIWSVFVIVSTFLYLVIGENELLDFNLKEIYSGFLLSFITLVSSDKAIKLTAEAENAHNIAVIKNKVTE